MVRSTFASFVTAQTGLNASQRALDVTGQNMTNVNTAGFTRQRLDLISISSGGYSNRYAFLPSNDIGQGVRISGVSRIRDPFLDIKFRREHAQLGEYEAQYLPLTDMETVFNEISIKGLASGISDFITQLQKLSQNTGNVEFDSIVRTSAENLTKLFNSYAKQMIQIREQTSYQVETIDIPRINTILESIASLNKVIREDQTYGNPSLELRDRRDLLFDELSQYMKIDVVYTPVEVAPGIVVEDVAVRLRDNEVPPNFAELLNNRDYAEFSVTVDAVSGEGKIFLSPLSRAPSSSPTDAEITSIIMSGTGVIKGTLDMLNKSGAFDDPPSDVRGIGYFEKALDVLAAKLAEVFNAANSLNDPPEKPMFANITDDSTDNITALNISVSQAWLRSEYGITTSKQDWPDDSSGARDNVLFMITLFDNKYKFDIASGGQQVFEGTFQEFFGQITNTLALDVSKKDSDMKNHSSIVNSVLDLRDGVSGVSLDEEGINLLRYQKSYNAAARFMTTLDEALDKLINGTGIVGR